MTGGTRGIRPIGPSESAPPAAGHALWRAAGAPRRGAAGRHPGGVPGTRAPSPPPAAADAGAPSVNLTVQFATGSSELTPAATHTLDELGRALSSQALAGYHFRIEGHTDTVGTPEHNQQLSEQRANAVIEYLVSKFGVDRARLQAAGMGENHLLIATGQNVAEPRNRRVTVVNLGT